MNIDLIVETTGWLLLVATLLRGTVGSLGVVKQRVRRRRDAHNECEKFRDVCARVFDQQGAISNAKPQSQHQKRKFRIARRFYDNLDHSICSFDLVPLDNSPIPTYRPGQFLTVELIDAEKEKPIRRCYSISEGPTNPQNFYRISVKRLDRSTPPGLVSNMLHDSFFEGDVVDVFPPNGDFFLDQSSSRPLVLIAGGVGITPLLSMLSWLVATQSRREVWLFYGVRNRNEHAFYTYLNDIWQLRPNIRTVIFYSQPSSTCRKGVDFDIEGHVSVDVMKSVLKARNYEFYLCGPATMMKSVWSQLLQWGVPEVDIRSESFGASASSGKKRVAHQNGASKSATKSFQVEFARTGERLIWSPSNGSLLEFAEVCGVNARCLCRAGQCGTCRVTLKSGTVTYLSEPSIPIDSGSCLPCIAQPNSNLILEM